MESENKDIRFGHKSTSNQTNHTTSYLVKWFNLYPRKKTKLRALKKVDKLVDKLQLT